MTLVSIILPAYNEEKYIEKAIKSLLNQTYSNFEILVIDDCSEDKTVETINSFSDSRIKLLQNRQNRGQAFSMNKGVKNSKGKFIARQDADDFSRRDRLEKQVNFLEDNPDYGVIGSHAGVVDKNSNILEKVTRPTSFPEIKRKFLFGNAIIHASTMIRKSAFQKVGGYNRLPRWEDYDLFLRLSKITKIRAIPEPLYIKRLHPDQRSLRDEPISIILPQRLKFSLRAFSLLKYSPIQALKGIKERITKSKNQKVHYEEINLEE